ncbi:TPA: hypothetical protein U4W96_000197 [Streptococcus agalactiae]|uniref:hypothetical protein n=1 Tax=Streptococcus agalactiae TaxID=1311 RepID=UPI000D6FC3DD|nr:hypothetical protein [Streptococcus agalactiae]PWT25373.1 hypothetical protein CUZ34_01195 [Streptococcus agalactiae]HEN3143895.1 hypothetical protein [Streptococcus agalactiae]
MNEFISAQEIRDLIQNYPDQKMQPPIFGDFDYVKSNNVYSKTEIDAKLDNLTQRISLWENSLKSTNDNLDKTIDDKVKYKTQSLHIAVLGVCLTISLAFIGFVTWFVPYITNLVKN